MKFTRYGLALLAMAFGALTAFPKLAMQGLRTVEQPDGSVIKIRVSGDEHLHFTTTEEGFLLCRDADGFYRLAAPAPDGAIVSTGVRPGDENAPAVGVRLADLDLRTLDARRAAAKKSRRRAPQTGYGLCETTYPHFGSPKGLIILVEYKDVKFETPDAEAFFHDMINGDNFTQYGGTGSAKQYFVDQSHGQFIPSFDVLGPVTLPNNRSYYGGNDRYGDDKNPHLMVTHAIEILNADHDFSQYDTDGDGIIDNVYVFYAGQGEANYGSEDTVWPHSWDVREAGVDMKVDGVTVGHYACSNEWEDSRPDGIGTFVHEFSHVMGLPDLYHTEDPYAEYTPDAYSVLDYGPYNNEGRTPPNYGAYELNALGWFEPMLMNEPMSVTLESIASGSFGLIPTEKDTEFFLFENRQLTGWDAYIPGHGMLVWHVDYVADKFDDNVVNNKKSHQYVDIVEANNKQNYNEAEGYTFPGTTNNTSFTSATTPALKSWSGKAIDFPVTDIAEIDGVISFDVAGGTSSLVAPVPNVEVWSESGNYFILSWQPVEGAVEYFVTVYGGEGTEEGEISTGFDGSKLSQGWEASASDYYTTSSNYGDSAPSFKFSKTGQTLTSPETDGDVKALSFWSKGQGSNGTYLKIEGLVDNVWKQIDDYYPVNNKTEDVGYDDADIPSGVRQIRFTMSKSQGNIAIDDIVISYGGGLATVEGYDNLSTGTETACRVENLPEDVNEYHMTVTASDGIRKRTSAPYYFMLAGEAIDTGMAAFGIETEAPEYYTLQGVLVERPIKGAILIERRGSQARKVIF